MASKKPKELLSAAQLYRLRVGNVVSAGVLAAEAAVALLWGGSHSVAVAIQYVSLDQLATEAQQHSVYAGAIRHVFDIRYSVLAASILLAFAVCNLLAATVLRPRYEAWLQGGAQWLRWAGLGAGGGVIAVALGLVSGVSQIGTLVLFFFLVLAAALLVPVAERLKQGNPAGRLPHVVCGVAFAAAVLPWVVLGLGAGAALVWGGSLPSTLYGAYASSAIFLAAWLLAAHFRILRFGRWADVYYSEHMHIYLGLAMASVLAWQILAGAA